MVSEEILIESKDIITWLDTDEDPRETSRHLIRKEIEVLEKRMTNLMLEFDAVNKSMNIILEHKNNI